MLRCIIAVALSLSTFAHGDLHERIEKLSTEIKHNPQDVALLVKRADLYRQHAEFPKALRDIKLARTLRNDLQDCFIEGTILLDTTRSAEAIALFDHVLRENPAHSAALVARARAHVTVNNDAAAAKDYARAASLLPKPDPDLLLEHARCLVRMEQGSAAIGLLDDAFKHTGPLPSLQQFALEIELDRGHFEAALKRLSSLDNGSQMRFDLMQLRGEILLKASRCAEAREVFEFALAALENQPIRNPRFAAIRTSLRAQLEGIYAEYKL